MRTRLVLAALALIMLPAAARADTIVLTFGLGGSPEGMINYVLPAGQIVTGVTVSGAFSALNIDGPPNIPLSMGLQIEGRSIFLTAPLSVGGRQSGSFEVSFPNDETTLAVFDDGSASYRFSNSFLWIIVSARGTLTITTGTSRPAVATPEPMTLLLLGTGLAGVVGAARRSRGARKTSPE